MRETMPYESNADLYISTRSCLPPHAQDIYRAAFYHAFMTNAGHPNRDEIAHRVAWGAVKRSYVMQWNCWVQRNGASSRGDAALQQLQTEEGRRDHLRAEERAPGSSDKQGKASTC
jgi:cation transport regulator